MAINFPASPSVDDTHTENSLAWIYNGTSWVPQNPTFDLPTSPAGSVSYHAATTAPTGWLKANGALIDRTTYADLFAVIGETYGAGDGSTTFALPDLRGEFLRSYDDGRGIDTGRTLGDSQDDAFQGHAHNIVADDDYDRYAKPNASGGGGGFGSFLGSGDSTDNTFYSANPADNTINAAQHIEGADGEGTPRTADETRPRNIALLAIIKY